MYSMKDLSSRVKKSPQALYSLIKQNESLSSIIKENTEKNGRFINYGEPVLEWLMDYYKITPSAADGVGECFVEPEEQPIPQPTLPTSPTEPILAAELSSAKAEIAALKTAIEALKNDLEKERAEKNDWKEQAGLALLALRQEQEEKKLYLPAPKKSLGQRIKGLFSKKTEE